MATCFAFTRRRKLRERSMIRRFYEMEKLAPGDRVALKEVKVGEWRLLSDRTREGEEVIMRPHGFRLEEIAAIQAEKDNDPELKAAKEAMAREET